MKKYAVLTPGSEEPYRIVRGEATAVMTRNALRARGVEAFYAEVVEVAEVAEPQDVLDAEMEADMALVDAFKADHLAAKYGAMTVKELRPLASQAGLKGARVAPKTELVDFLVGTGV